MNDTTPDQIREQFYVAHREALSLLSRLRDFRTNRTAYKSLPPLGQAISDVQTMIADLNEHAGRFEENLADVPQVPQTDEEWQDMPVLDLDQYHDEDIHRGDR